MPQTIVQNVLNEPFSLVGYKELLSGLVDIDYYDDAKTIYSTSEVIESVQNIGIFQNERFHNILVIKHRAGIRARVKLATETFRLMSVNNIDSALIAYYSDDNDLWRISLVTLTFSETTLGKIKKVFSNPRRYSYILGENAKTVTPHKYLISEGKTTDLNDLITRFSVEVVNNDFYKEISKLFDGLVGTDKINRSLIYPSSDEDSQEFAVRLIGRIIFCWFLREKKSNNDLPLIPSGILSRKASGDANYYHNVLAPLFFEVLNKPISKRSNRYQRDEFKNIPYLNGGLFNDDYIDHYVFDKASELSINDDVVVPDAWLRNLFELLERYNFTVDENTSYDTDLSIDPEMLGRVFENLLARINPETGETVRKNTGSFYTPREIVEYMVDTSLVEYLISKTTIDLEKIHSLISYNPLVDSANTLTKDETILILEALSTLTVLDPACGSGAFPIGMLQKIVFVITKLDPSAEWWLAKQLEGASPELKREFTNRSVDYIRKLGIIRQTIFGVDIQPIATEISRLRCFLTLIVDESVDDLQDNRGIRPLPNLDFKFVTANSLIPLPKPEDKKGIISEAQSAMFEEVSHIDELKQIRNEYFSSTSYERTELQSRFDRLQKKMILTNVDVFRGSGSKLYDTLSRWDPFEHKSIPWFDAEWMFGIRQGFDIVIGNPPYGADIDSTIELYKAIYPETTKSFKDIFKLFYEAGLKNFLTQGGVLAYITPNTLLLQPRYKDLRQFLLKYQLIEIINLGESVFDAVVSTCVILIKKAEPTCNFSFSDMSKDSKFQDLFIQTDKLILDQAEYLKVKDNLFITNIRKMNSDEISLESILDCKDGGIKYQRVNVGLSQKGRNDLAERLFYDGKKLGDNDLRFYIGKDLDKNGYYIDLTPERYLRANYREILRSNEKIYWNRNLFEIPEKIIWRQTSSYFVGTYISTNIFFANTIQGGYLKEGYGNKFSIKYILGLMNSKYLRYVYSLSVKEGGRVFPQVKLSKLNSLPIKNISIGDQAPIIDLVESILEKKKSDPLSSEISIYESKINELVYRLYAVSHEEISIIEKSFS